VPLKPRPPSQARSRETLKRMLDAAEVVLEKHGLEGATLQRIARVARLAPASVYRRFPDKDALMAAVFERFGAISKEELARPVDTEAIRKIGIRAFARMWIGNMIQGFRTRTGLIRAAVLYSQQHLGSAHVRRKMETEIAGFRRVVKLFLLWRDEIHHPDPEPAVAYAMVMVALALRELILFGHAPMFTPLVPLDDDHLRAELPRMFLRYLGVEDDETIA
jgi:AcrR family transcriptional regulator